MPAPSKIKGNGFERDVAKIFSSVTGTNWQRVPNSGSFVGGSNAHRLQQLTENQILLARGDLIPGDGFEKTIIECKFYKDLTWHKLFDAKGITKLNEWIEQVLIDHKLSNSAFYCVIFKINRQGAFIVYEKDQVIKPLGNYASYHYEAEDLHYYVEQFSEQWVTDHLAQLKDLNA